MQLRTVFLQNFQFQSTMVAVLSAASLDIEQATIRRAQ